MRSYEIVRSIVTPGWRSAIDRMDFATVALEILLGLDILL